MAQIGRYWLVNTLVFFFFTFSFSGAQTLNETIGPVCQDSSRWAYLSFDHNDCSQALSKLRAKAAEAGPTQYEFVELGATTHTSLVKIRTPEQWQYGTCVIVVVMLAIFVPGELPPVHIGHYYPETDVASYQDVLYGAQRVKSRCIEDLANNASNFRSTRPGWISTGILDAIGVFILDIRSSMYGRLVELNHIADGTVLIH